ncbi:ribosome biogenesis protein C1orf109 homolog isoform X2 [Myxocyprinus asiaticus]|uniref:ribosome biogenesis protein C1orf109 homolog isoform X2 n=1 Tax=Myxocyprinus asiaticus TaxID=70543 RepID=UPI002221C893|nr:ribosome biogenesis protein C1orf109 homolog isoform X2 [Myxocyprinus asiaticus]
MSNPVLVSLHQQLKTCFEVLKVNKNVWKSVLAECIPLISSLGNLAVQLKALKNVQLANTPLAKFPSLQERLHFKLSLAVDSVLGKLAEKTNALQTVRDAISQQVSAVFQFYEKNTETLDIACCVSRSAICPSIADMLEWLQDADCYYSLQLLQRRNLLQMLKPTDLTLMETAPKRWESLHSFNREERIAGVYCLLVKVDMLFWK